MLLVVERDPRFTAKLKKHLKVTDLRLFFVESTKDAAYLTNSTEISFMLVNLNAVSDWESLGRLLRHSSERGAPILFVEGHPKTRGIAQRLRARGEDRFLCLPFRVTELAERIQSMREDQDPLIGAQIGPPGQEVELHRRLGAGTMGVVYKGTQRALDRMVAVKFLSPDYVTSDDHSSDRFLNEARAMARIRSPHVGQVYFTGRFQGRPYLVMEFIDGPDLQSYLRAKGRFKTRAALNITREILAGLAEAHGRGVVHRDMKPANVMIGKDGHAVILDFGLVRDLSGADMTQAGTVLGTPRYISPEQVQGHDLDHRCDLYSVGIMLYEFLLGEPPFDGKDFVSIMMKHVHQPLSDPGGGNPAVDPLAFSIVQRLTNKKPADRYPDARAAIGAIDEALLDLAQRRKQQESQTQSMASVQPLGGMSINATGTMTYRFGTIDETRARDLHLVHNLAHELTGLDDMGPFERGLVDLERGALMLFAFGDGVAGLETESLDASSIFTKVNQAEIARMFERGDSP